MHRTRSIAVVAALVVLLAVPAVAQQPSPQAATPPPAVTRPLDHSDLRRHIFVMEGALARAVAFGARRLNREIRSAVPEMVVLSGEPQARGVYLEGYGVYFDVAVPVLNQMMVWSLKTLFGQDGQEALEAINEIRAFVARTEKNPATRAALENALQRLELQVGALPPSNAPAAPSQFTPGSRGGAGAVGAAIVANPKADAVQAQTTPEAASTEPRPTLDRKYLQDPNALNRAYTESVQEALIDAILDWAAPLSIKPDEFLTVAARDNMQRDSLAPPDPYEEVVTILIKISGSDLAAYRQGLIDAAEARRRIQIREW